MYWSFSFKISPSNEHLGLISFRMDWLDLLAVQGTLKSLLQHHSSKASFLRRSAFFTVHLSHPYMTTAETIALTRRTFVGKVMSLLFNKLSRLIIAFLPRSKHLLISWLQSPSAVILKPKKIKSVTISIVSPSMCHEVMGLDAMIFIFLMLCFKPAFSFSSFTFIKRLLSSSSLSSMRAVLSAYPRLLIFHTPGNLSDPGIEPVSLVSPTLAGGFFTTNATWEPWTGNGRWHNSTHNISLSSRSVTEKSFWCPSLFCEQVYVQMVSTLTLIFLYLSFLFLDSSLGWSPSLRRGPWGEPLWTLLFCLLDEMHFDH